MEVAMPPEADLNLAQPLLVSRAETKRLLRGVSDDTLRRLEAIGRLEPVRLVPDGHVFYRWEEVAALANPSTSPRVKLINRGGE